MNLSHFTIVKISEKNSTTIFYNDFDFHQGYSYLCLGFTGMQDSIVLVDEKGRVAELAYHEDEFAIN